MSKPATNVLLLVALVAPVVLFLLLGPYMHLHLALSAMVAVAAGWKLNVSWAKASVGTAPSTEPSDMGDVVGIARRFGWACPAVLVLVTWLVWRFVV